jgi:transposase
MGLRGAGDWIPLGGVIRAKFLSADQRTALEKLVRRTSEPHGPARRANALLLLDDGFSCEAAAKALYVDDDTVRGWYELWSSGGEGALKSFDFKGAKRTLSAEQEAVLIQDLAARLFLTSREVHAHILAKFGVGFSRSGLIKYLNRLGFEYRKPKALPAQANVEAQKAFIAAYEKLMNALGADEVVYFADAVHPEYQSRPAYGWVRKGDKVAVRRTTGRKRLNLHGALCLEDFDCQIIEGDTISAETTVRLLERLSARHADKSRIHVFLDNARYHHAKDVKAWLAQPDCRVELHFLPPYAPNLNAIERLWAVMHRNVTHNRYYPTETEFIQAVTMFFKVTLPNRWRDFRNTVTDNFHVIHPEDFRVVG